MLFTRTQRYASTLPKEVFISRLTGDHVKIHNLDFEVFHKNNLLQIVPHAEDDDNLRTLPITNVEMKDSGDMTDVVITSHMRRLDSGGPQLVLFFCSFLLLASVVLLFVDGQPQLTYTLLGMSTIILTIFYVRMQMGYFDYVRKIRAYVKSRLEQPEMVNAAG